MDANGTSNNGASGYPDRGPAVLAVTTTALVAATIFVVARLLSRTLIVRNVTLDDWFIVLAWVLAFGLSFSIDYGTSKGLGRHDVNIPEKWLYSLVRSEYAFSVLYNPALMATKTSILIFYLRLSRNTNKLLRIASYVTLGVVNVAGFVLTLLSVFQCRPVSAVFNSSDKSAKCIPLVTLYLASAPVNIITDLAILVLPIPVLTGMNLPQKQKTILVCTFTLGIFVTIVDVIRIYYLQQASADRKGEPLSKSATRFDDQVDFAYYASLALMWTAIEVNIGIICACVPTLKPLVSRLLPKLILDRAGTGTKQSASVTSPTSPSSDHEASAMPIAPPPAIRSLSHVEEGGNQEQEMGMMEFLTTPGMDPSDIPQTQNFGTHTTHSTERPVFFGFVNVKRPRSMLITSTRESFRYCILVTTLFFLWGFSYGLLNSLNAQISVLSGNNTEQGALGLQSAYFGGYLIGPLTVGRYVLKRGGFKATFITGLCIYGTGTLMFWPSAVLTSFTGFIISNVVVGTGLSVLETAANPFIALCGPPEHAELRLLLAQAVQGIGSVLSPLLAQKVFFRNVNNGSRLIDVQWTYLGIALFDVILALFFNYMPLPEASDDDLERHANSELELPRHNTMIFSTSSSSDIRFGKYRIVYITLALGIISQFLYVGAQESVSVHLEPLINSLRSHSSLGLSSFTTSLLGHTTFTISRFLAAPMCLFVRPRNILLASYSLAILFAILLTTLKSPNAITAMVLMVNFAEGPIFPIIFAISLHRLGRHTKTGASLITAATSGGAWFPWIQFAAQSGNRSIQFSFLVVIVVLALGTIFPVYLCAVTGARKQVDWKEEKAQDEQQENDCKRTNVGRRISLIFGLKKAGSCNSQASAEGPMVEHRERGNVTHTSQ